MPPDHLPSQWSLAALPGQVGREVAVSDWITIDQERIDSFAEATEDHQWIHTDPIRAASCPFGGTIAHGYLLVSLLSGLRTRSLQITDAVMSVNYGINRVRFTAPVPCGSRLRARFGIAEADPREAGRALQVTFDTRLERDGHEKPVCVAQVISRYYYR